MQASVTLHHIIDGCELLFLITYVAKLPKSIPVVPADLYGTKLVHRMLIQEECKLHIFI